MQLQFIEMPEIQEELQIEEPENKDGAEEETPLLSLYAIEGVKGASSMRVVGHCGKKQIQILIDNGKIF